MSAYFEHCGADCFIACYLPPSTFRALYTHRAIRTGMNKGKEKLNDTEKREEKERYDRRSEIITVDPHSTSMGGVSAGIEETRRQGFTRWKPISADWYLRQRYHRGPTLYHVAPRLSGRVFICNNRARSRDTILPRRSRRCDSSYRHREIIWIF